jgi:uncharacterized membrane protein
MSELRSVVVTVCCVVGFVLLIGGIWAYAIYGIYPNIYSERVYPYRIYGVPFVICGIALLVAGVMVYWEGFVKAS